MSVPRWCDTATRRLASRLAPPPHARRRRPHAAHHIPPRATALPPTRAALSPPTPPHPVPARHGPHLRVV
eukprot:2896263-Prymnesium_polylepis.1